jgi:CheY-like chemotaxis protein
MNSPSKSAEHATILLVDDNHHGLAARRALLQQLGHRIAIAHSGEEALELFAQTPFDVVVTDFKMPHMDGCELIRLIRESQPQVRVILLSGFVDPLGLTEENTGADVVISKSAGEVSHLVRAVDRLLRRRAPRPTRKPPRSEGEVKTAAVSRNAAPRS